MSKLKQFTSDIKSNRKDTILFLILWGLYTVTMLLLFHRQTVNYAGGYESDMKIPYGKYVLNVIAQNETYDEETGETLSIDLVSHENIFPHYPVQ